MMPIVTKVEKIENLKLQSRFLEAQRELISPVEASDWLFYGADDTVLDRIATSGFQSAGTKVSFPSILPLQAIMSNGQAIK